MRIAAGVLLLIAALLNILIGGVSALLGGAVTKMSSDAESAMVENLKEEGSAEAKKLAADIKSGASDVKSAGGIIMIVGIGFLVVAALQIAGAVQSFRRRSGTLVLIVGVLTLGIAGLSLATGGFHIILHPLLILTGVFAILAGMQINKNPAGAPAAAR